MALQGPHQVAKQSSMTTLCVLMASLNCSALWETCQHYSQDLRDTAGALGSGVKLPTGQRKESC
jgi:hypothetical protein